MGAAVIGSGFLLILKLPHLGHYPIELLGASSQLTVLIQMHFCDGILLGNSFD